MIEILALFFFSRKIKSSCEAKGIKPGKWIAILVGTWIGVELLVLLGGIFYFGMSEAVIYKMIVPALIAAIVSAFFVLQKVNDLDDETEALELDEFAAKEDQFKHFR